MSILCALLTTSLLAVVVGSAGASDRWWSPEIDLSLGRAPDRRANWESALGQVSPPERHDVAYLLRYLPMGDLRGLAPKQLLENVRLSQAARSAVPWGPGLPDDIYLDAVLPHASVTEPRQSMRETFFHRYLPAVKGCRTPGEAALVVNQALFKDYKVRYDARRLRTDQCAEESIAQGMATCTGLSIMLVEACRAVGIPARVAGIHSWPGRGGNHTWVEIWDGKWHFVGAAEPDPNGLDHGWFIDDASKAVASDPHHAIYAISYRETGDYFPLPWDPDGKANAVNVTARYAKKTVLTQPRLMVEVRSAGVRVIADVKVTDAKSGEIVLQGQSYGPEADVNFHLNAKVTAGRTYKVTIHLGQKISSQTVKVEADLVVRFDI